MTKCETKPYNRALMEARFGAATQVEVSDAVNGDVNDDLSTALSTLFFNMDFRGDYSPESIAIRARAFVHWVEILTEGRLVADPEDMVRDYMFHVK